MAKLKDLLESDLLKNPTVRSTAIGIAAAILVPIVAKALAPFVRPVARSAVKVGAVTFEKARETFAEIGEIVEDMVAEVRDELRAEHEAADAALEEIVAGVDEATDALEGGRKGVGSP
jgi:hypothetical protein